MGLGGYDEAQIKDVANLLESYGIEPTIETLQALSETAESSYPNAPDGLKKAAEGLVGFFAGSSATPKQQEPESRFKRWVSSMVLRIKTVGILSDRDT